MPETAYLLDNPPARHQYRSSRRAEPSGVIVLHTAESATDIQGVDQGAENVARFISTRTDAAGSYHLVGDRDSIIQLVPFDYEAFHDGTGSNRHSIGISLAMKAASWPRLTPPYRDAYVLTMAKMAVMAADWLRSEHSIIVPADHITKRQSTNRRPGFIGHGERDPKRRSDPGAGFPWRQFLDTYAQLTDRPGGPPMPINRRDNIIRWQQELIKRGQDLGPTNADGDFGDLTERGSFEQFAHLDFALAGANQRIGDLQADVARLAGQLQAVEAERSGWEDQKAAAVGRATMNWIDTISGINAS